YTLLFICFGLIISQLSLFFLFVLFPPNVMQTPQLAHVYTGRLTLGETQEPLWFLSLYDDTWRINFLLNALYWIGSGLVLFIFMAFSESHLRTDHPDFIEAQKLGKNLISLFHMQLKWALKSGSVQQGEYELQSTGKDNDRYFVKALELLNQNPPPS